MISRIVSLDLLKGFTILLMIFINFFDEVAHESLLYSNLGRSIDVFITALVPNVFIFLMGFFLIISKSFNAIRLLKKGVFLLFLGYLINISRYPYMLYLADSGDNFSEHFYSNIYYVNMVDIYLFLGYACLLLIPLACLPSHYSFLYLILSATTMYLTSKIDFVTSWLELLPNTYADFISHLTLPLEPNVYFPFLPWLAYLFLGIACGIFYKQKPPEVFFRTLAVLGCFLTCLGLFIFQAEYTLATFKMRAYFYQHDYTLGVLLLGICLIMPVLSEYLFTKFPFLLQKILIFTSKNIIFIYLVSWQIICYLKFVEGWNNSLTLSQVVIYSIYIYVFCLISAKLFSVLHKLKVYIQG